MRFKSILVCALLAGASHASAAVLYVDVSSANPWPPYSGWSTAARQIQDAVNFAKVGDQVLVTNGTYSAGGQGSIPGSLFNRVAIIKPLTVQKRQWPCCDDHSRVSGSGHHQRRDSRALRLFGEWRNAHRVHAH